MPDRLSMNLTPPTAAAIAAITEHEGCTKTDAVNRAVADYAARIAASDGDLSTRADLLVQILSDARISTLQTAFRKLGWPLRFELAEDKGARRA